MEKRINLVGSSWETWLTFQEKGEPWARRTCKISAVYPEAKSWRVTCLQMCETALRSTPLATGDHECPFCDFVSVRQVPLSLPLLHGPLCEFTATPKSRRPGVLSEMYFPSVLEAGRLDQGVGRRGSPEATSSLCPPVAFPPCIPGISLSKFSPLMRTPVGLGDVVVQLLNQSDFLPPRGLQHPRLPCPSLSSRVCSDSYPLSW